MNTAALEKAAFALSMGYSAEYMREKAVEYREGARIHNDAGLRKLADDFETIADAITQMRCVYCGNALHSRPYACCGEVNHCEPVEDEPANEGEATGEQA